MVEVAHLVAKLTADDRDFRRGMGRAETTMQRTSRNIQRAGLAAGAAIATGLGITAKIGWDEFNEGQKVAAQTNAVLKSTGGVANVTARQVEGLSETLMRKTGIDDEVIAAGENMLLTFRGVRNEVGKGNDIFNQATQAALDMSVATGTDVVGANLRLGKALQDPIRGLTALRRVGVQFTEAEEEQIKRMVESGNVMGAQKVILRELRTEFGGSAEAAGKTFAGQMNVLRESFSNWAGEMVGRVIPHLISLGNFFREHSTLARTLGVAVGTFTVALALAGAALFVYNSALGTGIVKLVRYLFVTKTATGLTRAQATAQWLLNAALAANPIGLVIAALVALGVGLVLAWRKSETFRRIVTGAFDLVKQVAQSAFNWIKNNWPLLVSILGGPIGLAVVGIVRNFDKISAGIRAVRDVVKAVVTQIVNIIENVTGAIRRVIRAVHDLVGQVSGPLKGAFSFLGGVAGGIRGIAGAVGDFGVELGQATNIVGLGKQLQAMGFQVGEHPAFGGVAPVHVPGSYHYRGRALDINADTHPWGEMRALDWLYARLLPMYRAGILKELLWRTTGHFDHLHLAMAKGGLVTNPTRALIGEAGPEAVVPLSGLGGTAEERALEVMRRMWSIIGTRFFPGYGMPGVQWSNRAWTDFYTGEGRRGAIIGAGRRVIELPKQYAAGLGDYMSGWMARVVLHEWAHAFQKAGVIRLGRRWYEGAASAFQVFAAPLLRQLGFAGAVGGPASELSGEYRRFMNFVLGNRSRRWIMEGQFRQMDNGGIVPGPRGHPVPVVLHGGETVLPTHRRGMGGSINIVINAQVVDRYALERFADNLRPYLDRSARVRLSY